MKLQIKFTKSKSLSYGKAVRIAERFSDYNDHLVTITSETLERDIGYLKPLWDIISRWKSTEVCLDGEPIHKMFDVIWPLCCYQRYKKTVVQQFYCQVSAYLPGWGCKHLAAINLHEEKFSLPEEIKWYQLGHFFTGTIWKIDKAELAKLLKREADLKYLRLCPLYSWEKIQATINWLPNEIDTESDPNWQIQYNPDITNPVPVSIMPNFS